jgi:hypothetical protein
MKSEVMPPKVLFVDLLYSDGGSLDEDMKSITKASSIDYHVEYLRFDAKHGYRALVGVLTRVATCHYDKIIFLSSKVSQLLLLIPLALMVKCYVIYHFMPIRRQGFHKIALRLIKRYFVIGVYAEGVAHKLEESIGFSPPVLPSRIIDRYFSLFELRRKLSQEKVRMLVPGIRSGVRLGVKLNPILIKLKSLGIQIDDLVIQSDILLEEKCLGVVRKVGKLPQDEYEQLYKSSLIVAIEFDEDYEVRASGVILDAIKNGCLVITSNHHIIRQYGFPHSIVTDLEHLESVLTTINNSPDEQVLELIPGLAFDEFENKWRSFLT